MTPPYRLGFSGTDLTQLHAQLQANAYANATLDRGCISIDYTATQAGSAVGAFDRVIQSCELFGPVSRETGLRGLYRQFAGESLPWLPNSTVPTTQTALQNFDADIAQWRRAHPLAGGTSLPLAQHIYDWVLATDGLGIRPEAVNAERNFDQALVAGRADCSEFFKILHALFSRAGFSPYPVWVHVDFRGNETEHVVTGLEIAGNSYLVDPYNGTFNAAHRSFVRMSLREYLGWHWINRAQDLETANPSGALAAYTRAQQIDPANPHLFYNRGLFQVRQSDRSAARSDYQEALRLEPHFHQAHNELGKMEYDAGNFRQATVHFRRAISFSPTEELYHRNLILALFYAGQRAQAQGALEQLLRLHPGQADLVRLVGRAPQKP